MRSPVAVTLVLVGLVCCAGHDARRRLLEDALRERAGHWDRGTQRTVVRAFLEAERDHGVDVFLLLCVAEQESHFRLRARSPRGARGIMQIRPVTAADVASRHGIPYRGPDDLFDPSVGVAIGAAYLAELEREFGSWELALAAYHRGPTKVRALRTRGRPVRSRYAGRVLAGKRELDERYGAGS